VKVTKLFREIKVVYLPSEEATTIIWVISDDKNRHFTFNVRMPTKSWNYYLPMGIDYHDTVPHYENHTPIDHCIHTGGKCYCDGSSSAGQSLWDKYIVNGREELIWACLEDWHTDKFK